MKSDMPTTGYDKDAESVNRQRSPWWHKWLFVAVAIGTIGLLAVFTR